MSILAKMDVITKPLLIFESPIMLYNSSSIKIQKKCIFIRILPLLYQILAKFTSWLPFWTPSWISAWRIHIRTWHLGHKVCPLYHLPPNLFIGWGGRGKFFHFASALLLSSANILCTQLGPRPGPTKPRAWSGFKLFDILMVLLEEFFEKKWFWKKSADYKTCKLPRRQIVDHILHSIDYRRLRTSPDIIV